MTQNGITWFRLCGFSGLMYNTISFHPQKVQILQKSLITPLKLSTDMDHQTAMLRLASLKRKGRLESKSRLGERRADTLCWLKLSVMLHFVAMLFQLNAHRKHSAFGIYLS